MTNTFERRLMGGAIAVLSTFSGVCATALWHDQVQTVDEHEEITKALKAEASTNKFDYMSKTYELQLMMNNKINNLMLSSKDTTTTLRLLSAKVDSFQEEFADEKKFTRERFQTVDKQFNAVDDRFANVEKNVATIARQKKVSLLGWEYGYGDE